MLRVLAVGFLAGALLGAVASCALFWLVDFSSHLGDLFVLSFYALAHFGAVGAFLAGGLGLLYWSLLKSRLVSLEPQGFLNGLMVFCLGQAALLVFGVWNLVRQRPTYLTALPVVLPILLGFCFVLWLSARASRFSSQGESRRVPALYRPRIVAALLLSTLAVPPIFGLLSFDRSAAGERETPVRNLVSPVENSNRPRLLVVGWDAATWDVLDPLLAQGRLPNLAGLIEKGSRVTLWARPQVIQPFADSASGGARSPAVWESIATGKSPRQHGIWDFRIKRFWGVKQPVPFRLAGEYLGETDSTSGALARANRFWSILDEAGFKTATVGWWSTWPAHLMERGIVVSNLAAYGQDSAVYPRGSVDSDALWKAAKDERIRLLENLSPELQEVTARVLESGTKTEENKRIRAYLHDLQADIFKYLVAKSFLAAEDPPNLVAVVFMTTDLVQHKFWGFFDPQSYGLNSTPESEVVGQVIPGAYEQLDVLLGELIETSGPETSVIVLSDHGAGPWVAGGIGGFVKKFIQRSIHPDYSGNHRLNGMASFSGPMFRSNDVLLEAWGEDIAPTILTFFGLPVADDMVGRPLVEVFDEGIRSERPLAPVTSYGPPSQLVDPETGGSETDEEMLERLKSLGYVQ